MKRSFFLLLIPAFISACDGPNKTAPANDTAAAEGRSKSGFMHKIVDPYFEESQDTVSAYGPRCITRNTLQDKNGDYWWATWQGIIRYDGKRFTNVTLKENLDHYHAFSLLEDKAGNLWFGTIGGGALRYDGTSFVNFTAKDGLAGDAVICMLEDAAGNIWFGTSDGASRYDGKRFINFTTKDGLSDNSVNSIAQDHSGKLWFGTDAGVSCYDGKSFIEFRTPKDEPFHNVRSILADRAGNVWIGSEGEGHCRYNGKSLVTIRPDFTSSIFEDSKGYLWVSAAEIPVSIIAVNGATPKNEGNGMALSRYDGKSFTKIVGKYDSSDNQIFGIMEDAAGNIWFGTMNGACRYDGKTVTDFRE